MCWDVDGKLPKHHTSRRGVLNQVQLSTYANCIGHNLKDLTAFLDEHIKDAIGSIHLLPIYPSTGDRGFGPVTYEEVDPELGSWRDVQALADRYQLCLEFMVNHISPASHQFQDFIEHGDDSQYAEMFVKWRDIWPEGAPSAEELQKIRTRKPAPPVLAIKLKDGTDVPIWCTFSDQQIDINPFSDEGWQFIKSSLKHLCEKGQTKLIRLDAFGYVTKRAGTSCFMQEPGVWELLDRIKQVVKPYGVQLLCEVHEDFNVNIELARHGYWVYDFALPLLVLHALQFNTAEPLKHWLSICPRRQITTLDTHDGMGVDDIAGLAPLCAVPELEKAILRNGGNINYKHFYQAGGTFECDIEGEKQGDCESAAMQCKRTNKSLQAVADYLKPDCLQGCYKSVPHQYNETYFSAVGEDPKNYLLARAVQFFSPGIPMVYYVGLLAGRDDFELMKQGSIRDINRHYYSVEEAKAAIQRPVVQALLQLCRFRNTHPAFRGRVFIDDSTPKHELHVRWYNGTNHLAVLRVDFKTKDFHIMHTPFEQQALPADVAAVDANTSRDVSPYSLEVASFNSIDALDTEARQRYRHQMAEAALQEAAADTGNSGASANGNGAGQPSDMAVPRRNVRQDLGEGLSLEAVAAADSKLADGEDLVAARKSERSQMPHDLADMLQDEMGRNGDAVGAAAEAAAAAASEQGSIDASATEEGSSSDAGQPTTGATSVGGAGGVQMQQLDLSWAWKAADKAVAAPTQRVAAAAG
jgi:sucrose phosphorylase